MSEVRFYHLQTQTVEQALPGLLSKAMTMKKNIIVRGTNERQIKKLSEFLWTHDPNSFLPHGTKKDGFSENQPIYLTAKNDNPNDADILIAIDGATLDDDSPFSLQCMMFDGNHDERLMQARAQWKALKETDKTLTYWQQTAEGWKQKN